MTTFAYTARDASGAALSGTIVAQSINEVSRLLRADGKYPVVVKPTSATGAAGTGTETEATTFGRGIRVRRSDVIQIATQLSIMIETGVTITEALDCIVAQSERPRVKQLLEDVSQQVHGGSDFSSALARHPRSFPRLFVALVKASEKSGMLSKLLLRGTEYLRDEADTIKRVRGALIYPGIMLSFAITTTIFLLAFVLPRFTVIYAAKAAALPVPTQILMGLSDFIVGHWLGLIIGTLSTVFASMYYFRSAGGARLWHWVQLNVPLLGKMARRVYLARGLRMLGTMGSAGVTLSDSVVLTRDMCGNSYYRDLWEKVSDKIQAGHQLSDPLFDAPTLVPRSIAQMLASGEKSGKLAKVMEQVAGFSEAEMKEKIAEMTRYIEPLMIMVMGAIIGGVALALLLPVFTISKVMAS